VAVKTPHRPSEEPRDLLREPMAPIGHVEGAVRDRRRMLWSIAMLVVLVVALAVGIVLRTSSAPTWEGDWKDLIVEAPAAPAAETPAYTGDWKDLIVEAPAAPAAETPAYTGDWKDLLI
jgi:hypothetical protein